jgi:hypothetical protein
MKISELEKKVDELLESHRVSAKAKALQYVMSGAIDIGDYEDDYILPRILVTAALRDTCESYNQLLAAYREALENLKHF